MTTYTGPLPNLEDPLTQPFWEAARSRILSVQTCPQCSYRRWPPSPVCPECQSPGGDWTPIRQTGVVWSTATYHRAFDQRFADQIPYTVALIDLDDGPRMYGITVERDCAPGDRVRAAFVDVTPEVTLIRWQKDRPSGSNTSQEVDDER